MSFIYYVVSREGWELRLRHDSVEGAIELLGDLPDYFEIVDLDFEPHWSVEA